MRTNQAAFLVLGGEVCAGVDCQLVLLETAAGQLDLLRVDQLEGWFELSGDGITRPLRAPTRQRQHKREPLRRIRMPVIRGKRTVPAVCGRAP